MSSLGQMLDAMVVEGLDDLVQAFEIALIACEIGGATTQNAIRETSLRVIQEALSQDLVRIGDLRHDRFHPWNTSHEESVARVDREWRDLKREPSLDEICWFENTTTGKERAIQVNAGNRRQPG